MLPELMLTSRGSEKQLLVKLDWDATDSMAKPAGPGQAAAQRGGRPV